MSYLDLLPPELGHHINKYVDNLYIQQHREKYANVLNELEIVSISRIVCVVVNGRMKMQVEEHPRYHLNMCKLYPKNWWLDYQEWNGL